MNKEELNGLLDNIYELEGLVHLALAREDCPESLPELIVRKANSLTELVNEIGAQRHIDHEDLQVNREDMKEESEVVENQVMEEIAEDIVQHESDATMENDSTVENDATVNNKDIINDFRYTQHSEDNVQNEIGDIQTMVNGSTPLENTPIEEISPVVDEIEESAFAAYALPSEEPAPQPQKIVEPRGKLVFTINDRYRFKRDLFCNSDADFNTTLALVASMDSYDEAEDYFLGELQWNPQREEVMDFLEILKNYFK